MSTYEFSKDQSTSTDIDTPVDVYMYETTCVTHFRQLTCSLHWITTWGPPSLQLFLSLSTKGTTQQNFRMSFNLPKISFSSVQ